MFFSIRKLNISDHFIAISPIDSSSNCFQDFLEVVFLQFAFSNLQCTPLSALSAYVSAFSKFRIHSFSSPNLFAFLCLLCVFSASHFFFQQPIPRESFSFPAADSSRNDFPIPFPIPATPLIETFFIHLLVFQLHLSSFKCFSSTRLSFFKRKNIIVVIIIISNIFASSNFFFFFLNVFVVVVIVLAYMVYLLGSL